MHLLLSILVSVLTFGAIGDGQTDNTQAINKAVAECARQGGGVVSVPRGVFLSGTIHMKSGVRLRLERGAVLRGVNDLNAYDSLHPVSDLSRYESGRGTVNFNSATDPVWSQAFIHFVGVSRSGIEGEGTIDGAQVFNPRGEEHQRGPHTILIANSRNLRFKDFKVVRASNYAILGYEIDKSSFTGIHIVGGWDGIHIRGCNHVKIDRCEMHTGDDAIAGGYWNHIRITHCTLNSSCNGIRMIQPSQNMLVEDCTIYGPGVEKHITSGNRNSAYAISLEPGGWGPAPGRLDNITLRRIKTITVLAPLSVTLSDDNTLGKLVVEDLTARDITGMALSVKSWGTARSEQVIIHRADLEFRGIDDPKLPAWFEGRPTSEWPCFPCYALYFRNVDKVSIRDTKCRFTGKDYRQAVIYDNVKKYEEKDLLCNGNHAHTALSVVSDKRTKQQKQ